MLIDEVKIKISAGNGGDGIVAFDKVKMSLGPTGGKGGNGGSVYFEGVADIFALKRYRQQKKFYAEDGKRGRGNRSDGPAGKDLILPVPVGTIIKFLDEKSSLDITRAGQRILVAKGGNGGRGNFYFRSSRNTSPKNYEKGGLGEQHTVFIELRLIADAGIIGLPSSGKSSLLNALTSANAKIGSYHFTTLEPNLGDMNGIILADIPGLIEGASLGKGLGIKFLRHIKRTKTLLHCVSLDSDDPITDWNTIRKEMERYSPKLSEKNEIVVLTKSDLVDTKTLKKTIATFDKMPVITVSIYDPNSLSKLKGMILKNIGRKC